MWYDTSFLLSRSQTTTSFRLAVIGTTKYRSTLQDCVMVIGSVMCFGHVSWLLILLIQDASNVVWEFDTDLITFWKEPDGKSSAKVGSPIPISRVAKSDVRRTKGVQGEFRGSLRGVRGEFEGISHRLSKLCNSKTWNLWVWKREVFVGRIYPPANVYSSFQNMYLGQF
jgi:hypothetical protein